ncbi:MAG: hypothetical protein RL417_270 [Pseudomonadota bacterium]
MAIETVEKILRGGGKRNPLFRGYTTLELTLAIPFVLTVLLGLTDLTAVVQGYTALQAGVRQGIRCVTATDGKCVSVSAAAPTPLFHWYRVQSPPSYIADRFDLRGNGYWLRQPTYRYTEARILDEVSYAVPVTDYTATRWVYPAARAVSYVVRETGGAFITGTSPTQPNFVYRNARSVQYPSNVVVSNGVNEELSLSRTTVDIVTQFALSPSSLPCFRSLELDEGPTALHHPSSAPCPQNRIPALIFVRGAARGHGTGQLRLSITGRHIAESDFGGQRFDIDSSSWRSRNFIPRGVTPGYVSGAFSEEPEYSLYAGKIVLEPGEHVTVTVSIAPGSLNWTDPAMRYRVTEVRIVPAITRSVETAAECPGGVPRGAYLSGAISCSPPYPPATLGSIAVDTTSNLDTTPPVHLPGMVSEPHAEETLQSLTSTPADFIIASTAARTELRTTPCPPNHGVAYPTDHAGFVVDPATLAVCPFEDPQLQRFGVVPTPVGGASERSRSLTEPSLPGRNGIAPMRSRCLSRSSSTQKRYGSRASGIFSPWLLKHHSTPSLAAPISHLSIRYLTTPSMEARCPSPPIPLFLEFIRKERKAALRRLFARKRSPSEDLTPRRTLRSKPTGWTRCTSPELRPTPAQSFEAGAQGRGSVSFSPLERRCRTVSLQRYAPQLRASLSLRALAATHPARAPPTRRTQLLIGDLTRCGRSIHECGGIAMTTSV